MVAGSTGTDAVLRPDLCVIGAGAGGLSVAASAALLGVPVVLIERAAMGGECLNAGCVPSKALIAAADAAAAVHRGAAFGVHAAPPHVERAGVNAHIRSVVEAIAPVDSAARYRALGVTVLEGEARFVDPRTVQVGETRIIARRFVIAAGQGLSVPESPGLAEGPYLTSRTIFDLPVVPPRLVILGGGPVGVEMAQAHRRLGAEVTVIEAGTILAREDGEAVACLRRSLLAEGVTLLEKARVTRVSWGAAGAALDLDGEGVPSLVQASHILVATGRKPEFAGLDLAAAGVAQDARGITVDAGLRTTNRRIYAVGDCTGASASTHGAGYHAGLVIRSALFRQRVRVVPALVPRVIYADPEIAAIGLSEGEARAAHKGVQTLRWPFSENDRARAGGRTEGFVKVMVDSRRRILGVVIAGAHAGELIAPWVLAIRQGLNIDAMIDLVLPYPTLSEASRRAALQSLVPRLRSPWVGRLVRWLRLLG